MKLSLTGMKRAAKESSPGEQAYQELSFGCVVGRFFVVILLEVLGWQLYKGL